MKWKIILFPVFILLITSRQIFSQKTVKLQRAIMLPLIDGRVNDQCWETATLINEFYQREPEEGKPMTEKTEFYICYTSSYIYFGIKCYEDPSLVSASEMLRDASTANDDRVHIILDTYLDHRSAYFFGINPHGAIEDALVSQNGNTMNKNWNGLFTGKAKITSEGWEAEVAIPFKTLGFDKSIDRWGLLLNRFIRKKREVGTWPVGNVNSKEAQVSDAGIIEGLQGITKGIGLDIAPYFITGLDTKRDNKTSYKINGGGEIFYRVTPGLKASLSVNTDFAETEADARQINLTRFSIRLNEKRNFFLDGANYFNYGLEGGGNDPPSGTLSPFFSRRIGLDAKGLPIPVNYGVKLTGQAGGWNIGLLHVSDQRDYGNSHFSAVRITHNIGRLSSIGLISTLGNANNESTNFLAGVDIKLASSKFMRNKNVALIVFGTKSSTENVQGKDVAWGAAFSYPNDFINFRVGHQEIGENFITGMGFVPRSNIRETYGTFMMGPRPNKWGIRQFKFGGEFDHITDFSNKLQTRTYTFTPANIRFESGETFVYTVTNKYDYLENDFNIYSGHIVPADIYKWWENLFSVTTDGSRRVFGQVSYGFGNFYTGRQNSFKVTANWKIAVPVFVGGTFTTNHVMLEDGEFTADIFEFNLNLLFSPDMTLYNYFQFDSQSKIVGWQTRFKWILKPGNEILLVWNSGFSKPMERHYSMSESALRLKLKYNIRF